MSDLTQAARDAEALRAKAIVEADGATLAALLGEDLVHIHTLGTRDDRKSYLAGISERLEFRAIERRDLVCRQYGDVVVMTGLLANTLRRKGDSDWVTVEAIATQVWDCSGGTCRLVSFHATRTPQPPAGDPPR